MLLAQASQQGGGAIAQVALGIGAILVVCIIAYVVISKLKSSVLSDSLPESRPLELNDFREMHRRGELTDVEYENLKATFLIGVPKTNELRAEIDRRRNAQKHDSGSSDPEQNL